MTWTRRARWPSCTASRAPSTRPSPAAWPTRRPWRPRPICSCAPSTSSASQPSTRRREASEEALALAVERAAARAAGDYARADELREAIAALGFTVRDTPQGPQVVPLDG